MDTDQERGFTILEVVICAGLLATLAAGGSYLVARAVQDTEAVRARTVATIAALQKMEQLRALAWDVDVDTATDLTLDNPGPGGSGLQPSPAGTLDADAPGYVDYLSGEGLWVPAAAAGSAVFARRWSVAVHPGDADTLVLRVVVTRARGFMSRAAGRRGPHDIEHVTLRTRHQP